MLKRITTRLVRVWRGQSPLQRFALFVLLLILCANIGLSDWFSTRTRETSVDEVVQKAYVISRMISDTAARSLDRGEMSGLDSATDEALKDRNLISITVRDKKGKVILEKAKDNPSAQLNTFQTPIRRDGREMGIVITHFSVTGEDGRLIARLRHTAAFQWGLFALVAVVLVAGWLWENRPRETVATREEGAPLHGMTDGQGKTDTLPAVCRPLPLPMVPLLTRYSSVLTTMPADPAIADAAAPDDSSPPVSDMPPAYDISPPLAVQWKSFPSLARDLCDVSSALQAALSALSAEEGLRRRGTEHMHLFRERVGQLQRQAANVAGRAGELITVGGNIVETVLEGCESPTLSGAQVGDFQSLAGRVADSADPVREAFEVVGRVRAELQRLKIPAAVPPCLHDDLLSATRMAEECSTVMRERVLPALTAARDDENAVAERVASLARLLEELDGRAHDIARSSAAVLDMADMARSLGRSSGSGAAGSEGDLLAARMEELAWSMTGDIQAFRALVGKAVGVSGTVTDAAQMARSMVGWAGTAVEDTAAASVLEGELLRRALSLSGQQGGDADRIAGEIAVLAEELQGVQKPLDGHVTLMRELVDHASELKDAMVKQQSQTQEYTGSLAVAGGTLRLAGTFLAELMAEASQLAELSRETGYLAGGIQQKEGEGDLEEFIRHAHERITNLLVNYGQGEGAPDQKSEM
ncbi:hypothetical protein [Geobacter sp. AOG1]|uniref:hypothetical protein n=1 Tax=Geobacter sp. AOG1 TaxID=1566346 RepID=UPI001CC81FB9|nr:hypothetical protein [Geobacter sp. AOG1]GFE58003.1 hypothetical protein AOG1_18830 [Geobacter sp. AOG1]